MRMPNNRTRMATLCAVLALQALPVRADSAFMMNPGAFANQMAIPSVMSRLERSHETIFGESVSESLSRSKLQATKQVAPSRSPSFTPAAGLKPAQDLVSAYPAAMRADVERLFKELLAGYHKIEDQFGIPRYDVGAAVAAFLAGSYMAYRDVDFPDRQFMPLVQQMRQVLAGNAAFARASNAQKQALYEQMAILGTYMALTRDALKQRPDARVEQKMRQAAKGYLEQFLDVSADRVQITDQGMVLR
ncbi:MAG: DUF6683 family protein [Pseudomonadota bacterium]